MKNKSIKLHVLLPLITVVAIFIVIYFSAGIKKGTPDKTVDIDLTVYSNTMVFSNLQQILSLPNDYDGKSIKLSGQIKDDQNLFYIEKQDLTGCCTIRLYIVPENTITRELTAGNYVTLSGILEKGKLIPVKLS